MAAMEGVTTAIVAFIFACLVWPHLVKNKPQFYGALGMVLVVILFDAIGHMAAVPGPLHAVMYVLAALVQILTILLLVLCVGGLTVRELAGDVAETVHVIRHGEEKPVIVPLTGEMPRPREEPEAPTRYTINDEDVHSPGDTPA
jgi:hypothetical protein